MELINGRTAEEIKAALEMCSEICFGRSDCPYYDGVNERCQTKVTADALALIERLEAAQPRWIGVDERLPEHGQHVYACAKDKFRFEGIYIDPVGFERYEIGEGWVNENRNVTHWMPLPEPPKGGA